MKKWATFRRIFVANRGEVAVRIGRACDALGISPVFGVSEADANAPYVHEREKVVLGPARASESYLDPMRVVRAATRSRCAALHPGWGFLSEDARFAGLCESHGVTFIGPPPSVTALMGKKTPAKRAMVRAGLDVIAGSDGVLRDVDEAHAVASIVGYPVLLKAESGGGGRGMRIAKDAGAIENAFAEASAEATAAFGDGRLYLERLVEGGRHVEVQVLADKYGGCVHLGERDCTTQRNHQKLIEESPSPALSEKERARVLGRVTEAARSIGYVGAGTFEFLLDDRGVLRFMEMNTRLQVEHPVTEMRTGLDLLMAQILVASGHRLPIDSEQGSRLCFDAARIAFHGHAIECRINAEDPEDGFRPCPGVIRTWQLPPLSDQVRVDTHVEEGFEVTPFYDSLIAKVIAKGKDRQSAADTMIAALSAMRCEGVKTTVPMHLAILRSEAFRSGRFDNRSIPGWAP